MRIASKQHKTDLRRGPSDWRRRGVAAVELAVVSPVLLLTAIGIIDVGQFVSVGQIVNNASREGARVAIRSETEWGSEVEAAIQDSLTDLMAGKTVIAIAHRLSTIAAMDRLIVMDQGRIAEQGTHAELLAAGGLYARLWARQSGGFLDIGAISAGTVTSAVES